YAIARAVFLFHPLVHWLLNRLDGEREQFCDAAVVRRGVSPRHLARVLLDCALQLGPHRPAVAFRTALPLFNRITVKDRIYQLLEDDMTRWTTPMSRRRAAVVTALVLGLIAGLGAFGVQAGARKEISNPQAEPAREQKSPAAVSAIVQDDNDRPIAGATVLLGNWRSQDKPLVAQSDSRGRFAFSKLPATSDR